MVRVGLDTLPRRMSGFPAMRLSLAVVISASAGGFAGAPGAPAGHSGTVTCPGAGSQAGFWPNNAAHPQVRIATIVKRWYMRASSQHRNSFAIAGLLALTW